MDGAETKKRMTELLKQLDASITAKDYRKAEELVKAISDELSMRKEKDVTPDPRNDGRDGSGNVQ